MRLPGVALVVVTFIAPLATAQSWTPSGPTGGDVRALAVDPRDSDTVYLGTADGILYRSDDGGRRWKRLVPGFPERGMSLDNIAVDGRGRVFVGYWEVEGVGGGVARSTDGGQSFERLRGIEGESVRALAAAHSDPDVLAAGTLTGVFGSEDGGESWRRLSPLGHAELKNIESVAIDPADPRIVYAGTWHLPWKTTDGGRTWRVISVGMIDDSDVFTITLDRRTPRTVYASACTGIYRSKDGAARWSKVHGIPASSRRTRSFAQDPERHATLFAGTTEGLWISEDDTATWRLATSKQLVVNSVARTRQAILLGCEAAGVLRSDDGGRTFVASNDGFAEQLVSRLLLDAAGGRLVAGIMGDRHHSGVLVAARPEGPWTRLGEGLEGREVLSLALADGEVLAGTDDGVFLSVSHCGAWRRLPTVVRGADLHPRVADVASAAGRVLAATNRGLLRSPDGGATWQRHALGAADSVTAVAFSPRDPETALATTPLGVFKSRDGGATWQALAAGVGSGAIRALRFLPGDDRIVFAATRAGLLRSTDGGRSWERRGAGLPLSDIAGLDFDPDGRSVYASDFRNGGIYVSRDAGASWTAFSSAGLVSNRVFAVAADPARPGRLFAGASAGGLHVLEPADAAPAAAGAGQ
ncbi:MAG TPA: hypothetical protein VFM88_02470 [Vicinamibacteria bacterium]|nr:hypothetical protein [Vicinamibacteria bacterium]